MDWYPRYPADYERDTLTLDLAGHGAYCLLIDWYMAHEQGPPDDDTQIARILRCDLAAWQCVAQCVRMFFASADGRLVNKRCEVEIAERQARERKRTSNAKKAAKARWSQPPGNSGQNASAMKTTKQPQSNSKPSAMRNAMPKDATDRQTGQTDTPEQAEGKEYLSAPPHQAEPPPRPRARGPRPPSEEGGADRPAVLGGQPTAPSTETAVNPAPAATASDPYASRARPEPTDWHPPTAEDIAAMDAVLASAGFRPRQPRTRPSASQPAGAGNGHAPPDQPYVGTLPPIIAPPDKRIEAARRAELATKPGDAP